MSQRDSGYARQHLDRYETPEWVTEALVRDLGGRKFSRVWEPAMGSGKMWNILQTNWACQGTDIDTGLDFLMLERGCGEPVSDDVDAIITNPPYELATEFVEHALKLMEPVDGLVAMLLRTDFDHAKSRSHLFRDCPAFAKKLVLTKRIVWFEPAPGEKGKSPSFNHAWFIWDWRHEGPPTIGYAP